MNATVHKLPSAGNKQLPFDEAAERTIIATCLIDPKWLEEALALLDADKFYVDANRRIFQAMTEIHALGTAVDVISVRRWLDKHGHLAKVTPTYLAQILELEVVTVRLTDYARSVFDCWRLRELYNACALAAAEIRTQLTPDDASAYIAGVCDRVAQVARTPEISGAQPMSEVVRNAFEELRAKIASGLKMSGISSGFHALDRALDGLQTGRVIVVAGRPGMGKSSLALALASNAAQNDMASAYFSLEMTRKELAFRMLYAEAMINSQDVSKLTPDDWSRLTDAAKRLSKLPLVIDESSLTFPQFRAKVTQIKAQFEREGKRLHTVVVDHLLLFTQEKQFKARRDQVEENTKRIKALAKELDVCVILLSQLNRAVESRSVKDKRPQLSDLRETGSIEQDADCVIMLFREDYYNLDASTHTNITELLIPKNRCGSITYVKLRFDPRYTRFDNLEEGEE